MPDDDPRKLAYNFRDEHLTLEPSTLELAAELDLMETVHKLTGYDDDGPANHRMLDMALALFAKLLTDPAYSDIDRCSLFAASCDTAMVWEFG